VSMSITVDVLMSGFAEAYTAQAVAMIFVCLLLEPQPPLRRSPNSSL